VSATPMESLSEADAANELMRLARAIAKHNKLYHAEDTPEISDADYDALVRRNNVLEEAFPHLVRDNSPNKLVGAAVAASPLSKVTHAQRMMSLDNGFSDEDIAEWLARVRRFLNLDENEPVAVRAGEWGGGKGGGGEGGGEGGGRGGKRGREEEGGGGRRRGRGKCERGEELMCNV